MSEWFYAAIAAYFGYIVASILWMIFCVTAFIFVWLLYTVYCSIKYRNKKWWQR